MNPDMLNFSLCNGAVRDALLLDLAERYGDIDLEVFTRWDGFRYTFVLKHKDCSSICVDIPLLRFVAAGTNNVAVYRALRDELLIALYAEFNDDEDDDE